MKFVRLNAKGISHIIVPLVVLVGFGVVGSYLLVKSHADPAYISPNQCVRDGGKWQYNKCEWLRYSYSGGATHYSAAYSFGSNFDVYYSDSCGNDRTGALIFYSYTLGRDWENINISENMHPYGHIHSNLAQRLQMQFLIATTPCTYHVQIWQ